MTEIILTKFNIDAVIPAVDDDGKACVQLVTYSVIAKDASEAVDKFVNEAGAAVQIFTGAAVEMCVVGMERSEQQILEVDGRETLALS